MCKGVISVRELSEDILTQYTNVVNKAFLNRKNSKNINPYSIMNYEEVRNEIISNGKLFVVYSDENEIVGGAIVKYGMDQKEVSIHHVCIDPEYQGQGYAKKLLREIIKWSSIKGVNALELTVGSIWEHTIGLYKSVGFKTTKIEAHIPHTYFIIQMKLYMQHLHFISFIAIKVKLIKSIIIFCGLYHMDSTPNLFCKLLKKWNILK